VLKVHLFGGLNLYHNQTAHPFAALPKVTPLLAYLLLQRRPSNRDRLAFTLWPDVDEATARGNLRRHLYELNRALPPAPPETVWLLREGNDVQWNPLAPYWLDVAAFETLAQTGRLAEASQLYKGRLLPLVDEEWLRPEQERLHNLFLLTLQRLIDEQRQGRRYADALLSAQRLLRYDPLHEAGQRQVMLFRYALGDRAGAIQAYQQFADLLERELGVPPMAETKGLRDQILANVSPAHLLDEEEPPVPLLAPARSSPMAPQTQLPTSLRPLIGRQAALAQLTQLLLEKKRRLLTLTGPSGIGKSRLALALVRQLADSHTAHYPDGFYFISLASLAEPEQMLTAIATRLNIRPEAAQTNLEALVDALRYRRLLLLLDNFEHLLPAANELGALLAAVPGLSLLVTSQSLLQLYGEQAYSLNGLQLPPLSPLPPPDELAGYEAVAFFVEAAQAANSRFHLNTANGPAVAQICHRLDGLPLALELAAARSGLLSPAEILVQLEDMLAFLSTPARDVSARHGSMEAALAWSYGLLSAAEQSLFANLSVFSGSFDLAGAAAVNGTAVAQTAVLLDSLRAKNLIRVADDSSDGMRLDMLFTIRPFAQAKLLERGQAEVAHARHAAYFAALCHFNRDDPAFNLGAHLARLLAVQVELQTAVAWLSAQSTVAHEQREQLGWLLRTLPQLYFRYGRVKEGIAWLNQVEGSLARLPDQTQPSILSQFAALAYEHGEYERADAYLAHALLLAQRQEDPYLMARVLLHQSILAAIREDYAQAVTLSGQAIALDEGLHRGPMTAEKAHWWQNRALDLKYLGRYEEALALLAEARDFLEEQGDQMSLAGNQHTVAGIYLMQAQYEAAGQWYALARETAVAASYPRLIWHSLRGLAQVAAETCDWAQAVRLYSRASQLALTLGFSPIPVMRRQEEDYLAQARQALSPAAFRKAWLPGEQETVVGIQ
jgi:predicted ATPase/DNA-binding SARP family transcriptional activator